MKRLVIALLACAVVGPVLAEDSKLIMPGRAEVNNFLKNNPEVGCARCGIVVSINVSAGQERLGKLPASSVTTPNSVEIQQFPVGGKQARDERKKMRQPVPDVYQVTVHNDDDTYSSYVHNGQPDFVRGDRVQLVDGKLQRY